MPELSPAAQAVLNAAHDGANLVLFDIGNDSPVPYCAAAALRAAADHVVPEDLQEAMHFTTEAIRLNKQGVRRQLLAIADELEA